MPRFKRIIEIEICRCNKCGHEWKPRKAKMKVCPKCHNYTWDD